MHSCINETSLFVLQFNDVREQVDHFESLLNFRDQLSQRDDQEQVNQLRTELMTLEDQNHLIMVHRSNQLSQLQSELERTRSEAFLWVSHMIQDQIAYSFASED